jgi:S-adenosylmethionine hydrolase
VITNIDKDLFDYVRENRKFTIYVGSISNRIQKINNSYQESFDGDLLAVFNSMNLLEIAIHKGQAADLMNLTKETTIRIEFEHNDYTYRKNVFPSRVF